ncbi:hypothetical protein BKA65DRAFT_484908 [Rhexocercosporidium sp. MPI-PUGE-AT-0058]|nr:hypothetical protein BKA65DRAFT_484908 [Rhexocercosporidium sp. MPI-PUGE-AT-0058]
MSHRGKLNSMRNAAARQERVQFLEILRGMVAEYPNLQIPKYIPQDIIDAGQLPDEWLKGKEYPYRSYEELLPEVRIDIENPLEGRARFAESSIHRPPAKTDNMTLLKKFATVRFVMKGDLTDSDCVNMLPQNIQTRRDDASLSEWARCIQKSRGESVNKMVPSMGMAFLIYVLDQEEFLEEPLCAFDTPADRNIHFENLSPQPDYRPSIPAKTDASARPPIRVCLTMNFLFEGMINWPVADLDANYGIHQSWATNKIPSAMNNHKIDQHGVDLENIPVRDVSRFARRMFWHRPSNRGEPAPFPPLDPTADESDSDDDEESEREGFSDHAPAVPAAEDDDRIHGSAKRCGPHRDDHMYSGSPSKRRRSRKYRADDPEDDDSGDMGGDMGGYSKSAGLGNRGSSGSRGSRGSRGGRGDRGAWGGRGTACGSDI